MANTEYSQRNQIKGQYNSCLCANNITDREQTCKRGHNRTNKIDGFCYDTILCDGNDDRITVQKIGKKNPSINAARVRTGPGYA